MELLFLSSRLTVPWSSSPLPSPKPARKQLPTRFSSTSLLPQTLHTPSLTASNKPIRAAWQPPQYVYPDPIPEFAGAETQKFRRELRKDLSKNKQAFGGDIDTVVQVCVEIFSDFLHKDYGGPGTLLVEPFTDMFLAVKERSLPGAPEAARAALLWAQNYVDKDWEIWTSEPSG